MNIYMYLSEPALNLNVPDRCKPLWNEIIALSKINNMSQIEQIQYLQKYHALLVDESSLDLEKIEKMAKKEAKANRWRSTFWKEEFKDLFSFLFIYWVCVEQLYPYVIERLIEGKVPYTIVPFSLGMLVKVICVYLIYKLLLTFMAKSTKRDNWRFWLPFIVLFLGYLGTIFLSHQLNSVVLFDYPLVVVVVVFGLLFLWEWHRKDRV
ncbi:hypothetical protein [Dubosiella newyorkensis]|uniref:hypothetical protein n=1 Tax=Dubosiella newyorkensis TaxID=1862672 RepID=UPI0023EF9FAC|nr:hypothetical protein [Dubosiella newyorkensis]